MKPTPSTRLSVRWLPTLVGLCAACCLPYAQAGSAETPAPVVKAVATPAAAAVDPLPGYRMKDGRMRCGDRLRMDVEIEGKDDHAIDLTWKGHHYLLLRKPTTTGAYHFDDEKAGLVMIQIPAKSMLFDNKSMMRLADDCNPVSSTKIVAHK